MTGQDPSVDQCRGPCGGPRGGGDGGGGLISEEPLYAPCDDRVELRTMALLLGEEASGRDPLDRESQDHLGPLQRAPAQSGPLSAVMSG